MEVNLLEGVVKKKGKKSFNKSVGQHQLTGLAVCV